MFDRYSELSRNEEILRRIMSPLEFERAQRVVEGQGQALAERPLDLSKERFTVYVPAGAPPAAGYGLVVFVAPWPEATEPRRWRPPLDRHGIVFVSAARSGNESKVYERRLPLALLAYENVRARYPIDPSRVWVAGFSGGARVAQAAALAYPDVFRGALLSTGSSPIGGGRGLRLPPAPLFRRFQESRLVFVTGAEDVAAVEDDQVTQASLRAWCVQDVQVLTRPSSVHEPLDPHGLDLALTALERPSAIDREALARCDGEIQRALAAKLGDAEAAVARGDRAGARAKIDAIDAQYGGLAAPRILELDARLTAP